MAKVNGRLVTCDRCGKSIFVKAIRDEERDGGFTRWTIFEDAEGWDYECFMGDLCPECNAEYKFIKEEFKCKQKAFAKMEK
jgi:hypothetical protein